MSVQRAIRRRRARKNGDEWPSRQFAGHDLGDAYRPLHPTKGYRFVSGARLRAQARLAELWAFIDRKMGRA